MTVTKVLIVYSAAQKIRRTTIILDHPGADDAEFAYWESTIVPGEIAVYIPLDEYNAMGKSDYSELGTSLDQWLAEQIGEPSSDQCAVVDGENGYVSAVVRADPRIDDHPDGFLIQEPELVTGDSYDVDTQTIVKAGYDQSI